MRKGRERELTTLGFREAVMQPEDDLLHKSHYSAESQADGGKGEGGKGDMARLIGGLAGAREPGAGSKELGMEEASGGGSRKVPMGPL